VDATSKQVDTIKVYDTEEKLGILLIQGSKSARAKQPNQRSISHWMKRSSISQLVHWLKKLNISSKVTWMDLSRHFLNSLLKTLKDEVKLV